MLGGLRGPAVPPGSAPSPRVPPGTPAPLWRSSPSRSRRTTGRTRASRPTSSTWARL